MAATERRIILVGKMGNGKSSTGNSLLGESVFTPKKSLNAVTTTCDLYQGNNSSTTAFTIVDTPGLMDTDVSIGERLLEIQRAVEICPNPHAFLLVFSSSNRMTKDEEYTIDLLRVAFGERVFDHCIVVFTHGSDFNTDQEFTVFWNESEMIRKLVERCGDRIIRIENKSSVYLEDNEDVKQILQMLDTMTDSGNKTYIYIWIDVHRRAIKKHLKHNDSCTDYQKELSLLVRSIGEDLDKEIWQVMLVGGALLAVGAVGVGSAGVGVYAVGQRVVKHAATRPLTATLINRIAAAGSALSVAAVSMLNFWRRY